MMAFPPVRAMLHMYPLIFSKPSKVQGMTYKEKDGSKPVTSVCRDTIFE